MYDTTASQSLGCLWVEMSGSQHSKDKLLRIQIRLYSGGKTCCISTPVRLEDALLVSEIPASPGDLLASAEFQFIQTSSPWNLAEVSSSEK